MHIWKPETGHTMTCGEYTIARYIMPVDALHSKKEYVLWKGHGRSAQRIVQKDTFKECKDKHLELEPCE